MKPFKRFKRIEPFQLQLLPPSTRAAAAEAATSKSAESTTSRISTSRSAEASHWKNHWPSISSMTAATHKRTATTAARK
jgi:hypothetical protein